MTNTIYVANFESNTLSVISGKTDTVTATIPVGAAPGEVATNPVTNTTYVSNNGGNTVSAISGKTDTVTATIPVGAGRSGWRPTHLPTPSTSPSSASSPPPLPLATRCR